MTQPIAAFHAHGTSDFVIPHADPIVALEALPLGEPFAEAIAAAASAAEGELAAALALVFPAELTPSTADAIAEYTWRTGRLGSTGYGVQLAELHHRALAAHPELARLLRSQDAIADVETAAANWAVPTDHLDPIGAASARAANEARRRFQITIARQIADVPEHELATAAKRLLAADALLARVAAERTRREAHATAELDRLAAEQRAASRAIDGEAKRRVREAAAAKAEADAAVLRAQNEHRLALAEWLRARLQARLDAMKHTRDRATRIDLEHLPTPEALYNVSQLIAQTHGLSVERIAHLAAWLDRDEERA